MVCASRSVVITLESKKSLMKFYFEFVNKSKVFLLIYIYGIVKSSE